MMPTMPMEARLAADRADDTLVVHVVDDDSLMLSALRRVFATARVRVQTYGSGDELLAACPLGEDAGALLLDVNMPGMTGLELQRRLLEGGTNLPIIFLSGSGDIPIAVEAMRNGAVDFLEKPFDNAELVARVRKAFAGAAAPRAVADDTGYERRRASLTPRECEVLDHMITGKTSKSIGRELGVSHRTVEIHRARVMEKMEADTLADLVRMALEADLLR